LISVSIAAQISTAPVALLYFCQFPNYFLLTNLFVIPLSFVMTILGVATLVFSFNSFISNGLGFILNIEIKMMNEIIFFIEKLPGALITNISISLVQVILMYATIVLIYVFRKSIGKLLVFSLLTINIILCIHNFDVVGCKRHVEIVVYEIPKSVAFQFCYHGYSVILSDAIFSTHNNLYEMNIKGHDVKHRLKNTFLRLDDNFENSFLIKRGDYIFFQNTVYAVKQRKTRPATVDLVIYDHNFSK